MGLVADTAPLTEVLDKVAVYLAEKGLGVVGSSIMKGSLKAAPMKQIAVITSGGVRLRGDPIRRPAFQVMVRDDQFNVALVRAQDVYEALDHQWLKTTRFGMRFKAEVEPGAYFIDGNQRFVFSLNFSAVLCPIVAGSVP
jgi:hypothetical protein